MASGLNFPLTPEGERPTTGVNQGAFAAAVKQHSAEAYGAVAAEKSWRFGYAKHVLQQTQLAAKSEKLALGIAQDGLEYLHTTMQFERDGNNFSLREAMSKYTSGSFQTFTVTGKEASAARELDVPYQGTTLRGEQLQAQVETWVRRGVIELDTGAALSKVAATPQWLDCSDRTFVLFGAGSAMGPFPQLMALGAHVIAIDLARKPDIWTRLISIARASPGKLTIPVSKALPADASDAAIAEAAGCDLLKETPEVRNWLLSLEENSPLVLGAYCYADGPLFVRVSMAMDAIIADLIAKRKHKPALAYLCTPTDCLISTSTARDAAAENFRKSPLWQPALSKILKFARMGITPNRVKSEEGELPVVDALVKEQGPNYCLAKRLQHWRAITARHQGCVVSSNVAPATSTASVVSNRSFALAYKGMHFFKPMEVFHPETSNAVMTALLVNDLRNPMSVANPGTALRNPMLLMTGTPFHGGAWRVGYKFGTIGPSSAIAYIFTAYIVKFYLVIYSVVQFLGWLAALFTISTSGMRAAEETVSFFTYLQLAEIFHAAIGLVPSSAAITAMQISSRVALVQVLACGINDKNRQAAAQWQAMFFIAWSITEVVRYSYYALNTAGVNIKPLTWLRYSTFLPLYPMGVVGELGTAFVAFPELVARNKFATGGCDVAGQCGKLVGLLAQVGLGGMLVVYAVAFPLLYGVMLAHRKKALGKSSAPKSKKRS